MCAAPHDPTSSPEEKNELLYQENQALTQQLETLKVAIGELEQYRQAAAIQTIATEAKAQVLQWFGILGIASLAGVLSLYVVAWQTTKETAQKEAQTFVNTALAKPGKFDEVTQTIAKTIAQDPTFTDAITTALLADDTFRDQLASRLALSGQETIQTELQQVVTNLTAQSPDNSRIAAALSTAVDTAADSRTYYVVAASSPDPGDLVTLKAGLDPQVFPSKICSPKDGNRRSVLLITPTSDPNRLTWPIASTQGMLDRVKKTIDPTAYVLPSRPEDNIFFDSSTCQ